MPPDGGTGLGGGRGATETAGRAGSTATTTRGRFKQTLRVTKQINT